MQKELATLQVFQNRHFEIWDSASETVVLKVADAVSEAQACAIE
jgi:hypothetical protein